MRRGAIVAAAAVSLGFSPLTAHAAKVVNLAPQLGLAVTIPSQGEGVFTDLTGDGLPDLVESDHGREWRYYFQGPAGSFQRVFPGTFPSGRDRHGCTAADFNKDGRKDVYCVRGACEGICDNPYPNELYLQRSDRSYAQVAGAWGAADEHGRGRGALAVDWDKDGFVDLIVVNEKSDRFPTWGNAVFRNDGGTRFVKVATPLSHTIGTMSLVAIPKASGFPDVALETTSGVLHYRNNNGAFSSGIALGGAGSVDVDSADLNGDGLHDIVIVRATRLEVRLNDGNYNFPLSFSYGLTQGRDVALCQLDGAGGVDIYVAQGKRPTHQDLVLLNAGSGRSYQKLSTPNRATGHGDIASCVPRFAGALGDAVNLTNNKWSDRGPNGFLVLKP